MSFEKLNINPILMNCVIEGTVGGLSMTGGTLRIGNVKPVPM